MTNQELLNYIYQARAAGMTNQVIAGELLKAGWLASDIIEALAAHPPRFSREKPAGTPKSQDDYLGGQATAVTIEVKNIKKYFGPVKALDDVSLTVKAGTVLALLGPNGAGKTTLVRILTTLLKPDSGRAVVGGFDVVRQTNELRSVIGLTGQFAAIDNILTGRENIELVGQLYHLFGHEAKRRAQLLLEQFDLVAAADRPAKTYSGGMKRRLDLAASLVGRPKILFLDEPTTGLDPQSRNRLWQLVKDLVAQGTTVLLTTQQMDEAEHLADRIIVIDHGRIIAQGTAVELKRQVGGDVLEIHLADHQWTEEAARRVAQLGIGTPRADKAVGKVSLPISGGAAVLTDAVRILDNSGIKIADVALHRPSLDDVFLALTGHKAEQTV
ncbi:MAG TPA: ATP-binding cassette domain-containing protein [Candidatus Paceibacterota bacterium]|nr:ATP-binding cassette domain-containing protein [Candidatus Paceibacterota bacterium]